MNREERLEHDKAGDNPVLFYSQRDQWGCFSNFSNHGIQLPNPFRPGDNLLYITGEHRFQAMKAKTEKEHKKIAHAPTAARAKVLGGPHHCTLRDGWDSIYGALPWYVMCEVVIAKAIQNGEVLTALIATNDRFMYEDSPIDDIWGWRYRNSYNGKNLLGLAWMYARSVLLVAESD